MAEANDRTAGADIDLSSPRVIHIVGVGGVGMAPISGALVGMGHRVSGSDHLELPILRQVRDAGVRVLVGHDAANIPGDADVVAYSTAVPADNLELRVARERGIPVVHRSGLLAAMAAVKRTIGVAGTHGKTTTSAMLAHILGAAGERPSFVIGGELADRGLGATWDDGEWFIVEADESDGSGFALPCAAIIVTNIEPDHLEYHGSVENLHAAFARFMGSTAGPCVVCADDEVAARLGAGVGARSYGTAADADVRIIDAHSSRGRSSFSLLLDGESIGAVDLSVPGMHNIRNATAAITLAIELGVEPSTAIAAMGTFAGVSRRFQFRGVVDDITFVDDFAHLPTEIAAAVAAAHDGGWGRVVAVFQPHRYSRTQSLWREFGDAFVGADDLVLTDVYAAAEAPREGVSGRLILDIVRVRQPQQPVTYVASRDDLPVHLAGRLRPGDLCLTIGAGDITRVADEVIDVIAAFDAVEQILGDRARRAAPLGALTTYRVGGRAALLATIESVEELCEVARVCAPKPGRAAIPMLVIGRGSNLLVADEGFAGLAVQLGDGLASIEIEGGEVRVGAAAALPVVARRTVAAGLTGFEWAVGVPGSIGGAVCMNAGGHGSDMAASLVGVRVVDLRAGEDLEMSAAELALRYRSSAIGPQHVVVEARFALDEGDQERGEAELAEIVRWRREHQPGGANAGSVFTNPPGDSAGRLLDDAGLRGVRIGGAEVSTKHANFIQVDPDAQASDVALLMAEMRRRVMGHHGIDLRAETRMIGFEPASAAAAGAEMIIR